MSYLIGIDVGTSGTKTLLVDEAGQVIASATAEYPLSTPRANWAEQEPADWWAATVATLREVLSKSGVPGDQVRGLGLSGQMHGSVFLDAAGEVIRPAILWCDQRTADQCAWITEKVGREDLVAETCNQMMTGFTAPKIVWLRDNEPAAFERLRQVLLPKDYIRYRLTGEFATEVSDASGMGLLNVPRRQWSPLVVERVGLSLDLLPTVYESFEVSGRITPAVAELTGLAVGTPVVGGGGDQAAGAVGNGIVEPGIVSSTTGTSGVVFAHLHAPLMDPQLRTNSFCHAVPGAWHVMGVMLSAGGSLRWYRDALCAEERTIAAETGRDPYEFITEAAGQAPLGAEGLLFLPYLTGERTPYPDPDARGVFFGLHLRHDKRHLARAIMEGVSFGLRDSFQIIEDMGCGIQQVRASGGGARSALWRQMQADVTGRPHCVINVDEGPAFGVALLAGVGTGVWGSVPEACRATILVVDEKQACPAAHEAYGPYYALYQKLYRELETCFDDVAHLSA
jgi:xylulokinase